MANLPYHEDNQVNKEIALNKIVARTQQFLDGAITDQELAHECVLILDNLGIQWD